MRDHNYDDTSNAPWAILVALGAIVILAIVLSGRGDAAQGFVPDEKPRCSCHDAAGKDELAAAILKLEAALKDPPEEPKDRAPLPSQSEILTAAGAALAAYLAARARDKSEWGTHENPRPLKRK